uniref:Uncharacterized protein n=1 Tax=Rhinolophus ferrumequinum TaxID=59479 RepID=A0A671G2P0_RHIFE
MCPVLYIHPGHTLPAQSKFSARSFGFWLISPHWTHDRSSERTRNSLTLSTSRVTSSVKRKASTSASGQNGGPSFTCTANSQISHLLSMFWFYFFAKSELFIRKLSGLLE